MSAEDRPLFEKIVEYYGGFFGIWMVAIGRRAGLFAALKERGPIDAAALATALAYDEKYVATWCRGAYAFGLIEHTDNRFSLTDEAFAVLLDPGNPSYMGGRGEFFTMLTPDLEMYPARMADGGTYPLSDRPPAVADTLQAAALPDAPNAIANVVPKLDGLEDRLAAGGDVLDAGCLAGSALAAFAGAFPDAKLMGIDLADHLLDQAREALGDRATIEHKQVTELGDGQQFDLIWCNIALSHTWGAGPEVIAALRGLLKPGGWLIASDVPNPPAIEGLRSPTGRMFVGVSTYVSLMGPGLLTEDQLISVLEQGGFAEVKLVEQPARTRMMVAARA
jgi:SAM-dependent methyltransferase